MEPESPFDPPSETTRRLTSPFAHDPEPRLGIVHLMGWTGFTAAFMGLHQFLLSTVPGISDSPGYGISQLAWGLGAGIAVGSLLMMVLRRRRRICFPAHPGEFLLVLHGLAFVVSSATWGAMMAIVGFRNPWSILLALFVSQSAVIFTAIWAFQRAHQRHWRVFFVSFVVLTVLQHAVQLALPPWYWFPAWMPIWLTMVGLLGYAVLVDRRTGERRPWTHWLGITLQVWLWFTEWILPLLFPLR